MLTPELCDEHKNEESTPMLLKPATSRNVSLLVPRSRKGKFPTKLFERYARRCRSVDQVLLACFCLGCRPPKPHRCWRQFGGEGLGLNDFANHAGFRLGSQSLSRSCVRG